MRSVTLRLIAGTITAATLWGCDRKPSQDTPDQSAAASRAETALAAAGATEIVAADGRFRVPADYRTTYEHLGTWSIGADAPAQGAAELHQVWASPGVAAVYRRTGHFPDGAVLVKEVFETVTGPQTTAPLVSRAAKLKGWFVMVRDTHAERRGSKLWGDGWGWSWFDADNPTRTTSTDYESDCKGCHVPAQKSDWIYVEGYPALAR